MHFPRFVLVSLLLACPVSLILAQQGPYPIIGGLPADSGFALGAGYRQEKIASGPFDFRGEVIASVKQYEHLELHLDAPRLSNERFFVELAARYRNYPEENFWGIGDTDEGRRTNFRLEDLRLTASGGFRPGKNVRVGATGGYLQVNTGPGKDSAFPSIEQLFLASEVPGLVRQPDYFLFGAFVNYDSRDSLLDPRAGGFYEARWTSYEDQDFELFNFRQFEVDLQRFFPVHDKRGTVAARGHLILTDTSSGQQVPFFMQPTVGGNNDVRGYRQYRFRDNNRLVLKLEYRWAVVQIVDLVAFGDAGRVFGRRDEFGFDDLRGSLGVGGRVKFRERVLFGIDIGYSREGFRFWLRGSHVF